MMDAALAGRGLAVRAAGLYGPVACALGLAVWRRPSRTMGAAVLLGVLWMLPALLALQMLNQGMGWWRFATEGPVLLGMPVELYLGWCFLWGAVPVLGLWRLPVRWAVAAMVLLDVAMMPWCGPVVVLGRGWLVGEAVAALGVLLPGLLLARWTVDGRRVGARGAMQALMAGGIFCLCCRRCCLRCLGGRWSLRCMGGGLSLRYRGLRWWLCRGCRRCRSLPSGGVARLFRTTLRRGWW